ncbi:DUF6221 family protein [Streptomyces tendae]
MNDEFLQWLREQLDDDAELAASGETWTAFDESTQGTRRVDVDHSIERVVACTRAWRGLHIARHDPARVLREIDAKRQVIARYEQVDQLHESGAGNGAGAMRAGLLYCLMAYATVYADRPGYRDEWRPQTS